MAEPGFNLRGTFYPAPAAYQSRHMALVKHVTDMPFRAWARALNDPEAQDDPLLLSGLVAVAWWQQNPGASRDVAYEFGDTLDINDVEFVGFEQEDDAGPPGGGDAASSSGSSSSSSSTPDPSPTA